MKKADLVKMIKEIVSETLEVKMTNKEAEEITSKIFERFVNELKAGNEVILPSIGKLVVVETKERKARNPQTGEEIIVPAGKKVKFKASSAIKEAIK